MTAYGAVKSLRNTIDYILHSSHFRLVPHSRDIIKLAYKELQPLQEMLERLDSTRTSKSRKEVNALDGRIKEILLEFEDLLESLVYQQIHSQIRADQLYEEMKDRVCKFEALDYFNPKRLLHYAKHKGRKSYMPRFSIDLQFLQHDVPSFIQRLKDMKEEYVYEVDNMPEDDDEFSITRTKSKMIGLSDQIQQIKVDIMYIHHGRNNYITLVGTAGVGKTALAEAVFEDPEITSHFDHRAWVTVGRKSQLDQVLQGILAQMFGITQVDDELGPYLKKRLQGKRCLIVLDDVWERQILDSLLIFLPNILDGSIHLLVTTRDRNITFSKNRSVILVRFLNEEESKELLCEKVFGEKICPFQLDKAVTKIAKNCEGLPLMIVTVADILSKEQNADPIYWDDVAYMRNSVFNDAYNEISKVLFPSYDYLPQYLKMVFLYMGVFPPDYDIPISRIMNMLATEGWCHNTNLENSVWEYLEELCTRRNLALYKGRSVYKFRLEYCYRNFKTCFLHSSWRYVCRREARRNKFYHVLNKLVEGLEDGVKGQRCLCLENNLLFGIKEFCNSLRLNCASSTRSLLFLGPYHQYPIPVGDNFKLLAKLDALKLRLYTFPKEILTLVLLKYLALTCNGELPTTISKLFNLRVLIIHPHNIIRIRRAPSYIPIEIWDMQELEHIEILGKSLVAPCYYASWQKLSTLVGVNAGISTILELSQNFPCIRKLGVQIELTPYDDHNDLLSCFGCISTLGSLKTLKYSIINPVFKYDHAFPSSLMMLPRGLEKLHLSGMGLSWEYMDVIGFLPFLEVLKLRGYAFRGSKWEAQEESFLKLRFLLIEDSDLVQWKPRSGSFPKLTCLSMKHCYKIEEINWPSEIWHGAIELVNCNPVALTCARQLQLRSHTRIDVTASFSFDNEKPTTVKFPWHEL
ncbi:putative late blight resistance protein homolog R1B-12 [Salvia miltiorrhiza]|uniref:putative late blight resistance protein homolog R1B-12 n=1 Tax=Salvia miltiorrhiza TaxID=226208 RepID=UPI0025AD7BC2|nr:putative late blight resistance protein homolog R1B-12 [Salvia miltiorrhiza]XP_057767627.1 putative late blight resistance protein homolog R1B-12 [Salvia miltiorrhiza]XP_057767628.1 putative late blight resistance protein homolog R1B-12 [Salvia miltiorrhiza]XP_057767629.1 putative late blight resistance protein homolog R1B-12 [Salvia miltiorrhiza]